MKGRKDTGWLVDPVTERDHLRGTLQAEITVVEYGDYECPFSKETFQLVNELQRRFGDKLCFAFRHFPKQDKHPHAELAAEAAEEAGAEGVFWPMHAMLFDHQDALEVPDLLAYARTLELEPLRFAHQLGEHGHHERIQQDRASGERSGVKTTPAVFINGRRFKGDTSSLAELQAAIEAAA